MNVAAWLTVCPKCGLGDASVTYHKQGCEKPACFCATCRYGSHAKAHVEHLHYTCQRCLFDWTGPTADDPAPKKARS